MEQDHNKLQQIRDIIKDANDDAVINFMTAYALGSIADLLIQSLDEPARQSFFQQMKIKYPQYWEQQS
jgi:wobble nucleotide-excising tRNase